MKAKLRKHYWMAVDENGLIMRIFDFKDTAKIVLDINGYDLSKCKFIKVQIKEVK